MKTTRGRMVRKAGYQSHVVIKQHHMFPDASIWKLIINGSYVRDGLIWCSKGQMPMAERIWEQSIVRPYNYDQYVMYPHNLIINESYHVLIGWQGIHGSVWKLIMRHVVIIQLCHGVWEVIGSRLDNPEVDSMDKGPMVTRTVHSIPIVIDLGKNYNNLRKNKYMILYIMQIFISFISPQFFKKWVAMISL